MKTIEKRQSECEQEIINLQKKIDEYKANLKNSRTSINSIEDLYFELRKNTKLVELHEYCFISERIMLVIGPTSSSNSSGRFTIDYYPRCQNNGYEYKTTISGAYQTTCHHSRLQDAIAHICETFDNETKREELRISRIVSKKEIDLLKNICD